jgi:type IX secretion system substrate protein
MKGFIITGALIVFAFSRLHAQNSLYISSGAAVYISAGASLTTDGLVITPSSDFAITGLNDLTRNTTLFHTSANPHIQRVYRFANTLSPFSGTLTIYYRDVELNGLVENELTLNVHNGTSWSAFATNITRNGSANFVTTSALTNISLNELTLASETLPLPMHWLKVEATRRNNLTYVSWRTADETNCESYQVQKSFNGRDWKNAGSAVAARNEAGPNDYQFTDAAERASLTYYRIVQTNRDGKIEYSIIVVIRSDNTEGILLYPNPAGDQVNILAEGRLQLRSIQIYNAAGMLIAAENITNTIVYTLNTNRFPGGNYTVLIRLTNGTVVTRSFIKL